MGLIEEANTLLRLQEAQERIATLEANFDALNVKHAALTAELREAKQECERLSAPVSSYDATFGDDTLCTCGHVYYRHFDSYDHMRDVGCKYCECMTFASRKAASKGAPHA